MPRTSFESSRSSSETRPGKENKKPTTEELRAAKWETAGQRKEEGIQQQKGLNEIRSALRSQSGRQEEGRQKAQAKYEALGAEVDKMTMELNDKFGVDPHDYFNEGQGIGGKISRWIDSTFRAQKVAKFTEWKKTYDAWVKQGQKFELNSPAASWKAETAREEEGFDELATKSDLEYKDVSREVAEGIEEEMRKEKAAVDKDVEEEFFRGGKKAKEERNINKEVRKFRVDDQVSRTEQVIKAREEKEAAEIARMEGRAMRTKLAREAEILKKVEKQEQKEKMKRDVLTLEERKKEEEFAQVSHELEKTQPDYLGLEVIKANAAREAALAKARATPEGTRKSEGIKADYRLAERKREEKALLKIAGEIDSVEDKIRAHSQTETAVTVDLSILREELNDLKRSYMGILKNTFTPLEADEVGRALENAFDELEIQEGIQKEIDRVNDEQKYLAQEKNRLELERKNERLRLANPKLIGSMAETALVDLEEGKISAQAAKKILETLEQRLETWHQELNGDPTKLDFVRAERKINALQEMLPKKLVEEEMRGQKRPPIKKAKAA